MKKSLIALSASLLLSTSALAHSTASEDSVASLAIGVSMVTLSAAVVVAAPVISVMHVAAHASQLGQVLVKVKDEQGREAELPISKQAAERAGLKAGDTLTTTPRKSGVLVSKSDKPVAFVVPERNADLSRNSDIAK